jgi:hypothetical protein
MKPDFGLGWPGTIVAERYDSFSGGFFEPQPIIQAY